MSYQALARKWRPKTFDQVIGQAHVVSALTNGLDNQRVHHAFLFTGTRGVGKTTLARIFAKALNCAQGVSSTPCGECVPCRGVDQGNFIDLIEVDAASRTKVDDTRELLDNVQYTPSQGRFKIYLIDEVHMLSTHSFNALLKTLEEPPEHVKFLLATTDPQKLPATILSRCIQFNLKALDIGQLTAQLEKILQAEGVEYDRPALSIMARAADGSVRDALSLLDQGIAFGNGEVRDEKIRAMLGMIDDQFTRQLIEQIALGQGSEALETVAAMAQRSADFSVALDEILTSLHNLSLYQINPRAVEWKGVDTTDLATLAAQLDGELLQLLYQIALIGKRDLGLAPDSRSGFEMVLLRMIAFRPQAPVARPAASGKPKPEPKPEPKPKPDAQPTRPAAATNPRRSAAPEPQTPPASGKPKPEPKPTRPAVTTNPRRSAAPEPQTPLASGKPKPEPKPTRPAATTNPRRRVAPGSETSPTSGKPKPDAPSTRPAAATNPRQSAAPEPETPLAEASPTLAESGAGPETCAPIDATKAAQTVQTVTAAQPLTPDANETNEASQLSDANEANYENSAATAEANPGECNFALAELSHGDRWAACIEQSGVRGLTREMMMQMAPESVSGDTLHLRLDAAHGHLLTPERVKIIEAQLAARLSRPLRLEVRVAENTAEARETPSRQRQRVQRENQQRAERAFRDDPTVRELVDLFDAEIVGDSIRPPAV